MSQYLPETRDVILAYLDQEFPGFAINEETDSESYCFRLKDNQQTYFLRVMFSAVDDDASSFMLQLEQYAVASTMRGLGDFPVVVTESGCIFGSP